MQGEKDMIAGAVISVMRAVDIQIMLAFLMGDGDSFVCAGLVKLTSRPNGHKGVQVVRWRMEADR